LTQSAWRIGIFTNHWLIMGVATQAVAQLAITYLPAMNPVFQTAPLDGDAWLRIFAIALVVSLVLAAEK
jgi:cation-transporting ATPase F